VRRVHVEVSGRVQGVFYRATCTERARELGLGGWVRNGSDGVVDAEFEGDEQAVETIVAWCRVGPATARVDSVQVREEPLTGERSFRVTR
jgi:acylphosphatase